MLQITPPCPRVRSVSLQTVPRQSLGAARQNVRSRQPLYRVPPSCKGCSASCILCRLLFVVHPVGSAYTLHFLHACCYVVLPVWCNSLVTTPQAWTQELSRPRKRVEKGLNPKPASWATQIMQNDLSASETSPAPSHQMHAFGAPRPRRASSIKHQVSSIQLDDSEYPGSSIKVRCKMQGGHGVSADEYACLVESHGFLPSKQKIHHVHMHFHPLWRLFTPKN